MNPVNATPSIAYTSPQLEPDVELGIAGEIALIMLNNENAREESERAEREQARAERQAAAEQEVQALVDSAEALRLGAWVSGTIAVAAGGLTVAGGVMRLDAECSDDIAEAKLFGDSGEVLGRLAGPADTLVGQSQSQLHQAEAKRAAFLGEQAGWRAGDADDGLRTVERNRDRALDALEAINEGERATTNAVIQNI